MAKYPDQKILAQSVKRRLTPASVTKSLLEEQVERGGHRPGHGGREEQALELAKRTIETFERVAPVPLAGLDRFEARKAVKAAMTFPGGTHDLWIRYWLAAAGIAAATAVAWYTEPGRRFFDFAREAWAETKKVVWPTRKEAMQMTGYVFAFVVVMALFLWLTDKTLEWVLYDLILGWKR